MPTYTLAQRRAYLARKRAAPKRRYARKRTTLTGRGAYGCKTQRNVTLRGRGGFWGDLWNGVKKWTPKGTLSFLGGAAGSALGGPAGFAGGTAIGTGLSKILGFGAYKMQRNSLTNRTANQVPAMHSTETGIRVVHKEYLCDITSSTAFQMQQAFNVNPGLQASFPWLSQIAQNFEEWQPNGLVYYFRSTAGDALSSADNALGTVIMAAEYNPVNANFVNKVEMENTMWSTSGKPSVDNVLPIECARRENPQGIYYIRQGAQPANTDLRLYDLAVAQIATQGSQGAYDVGELWVSYDITFKKPIIQPTPSGGESTVIHTFHQANTTSVSTSNYFGTAANSHVIWNSFPQYNDATAVSLGTATVTLATGTVGNFLLAIDWVGGAVAVGSPSFTPSGSAHSVNLALENTTTIDDGPIDYAPGTLGGTNPTSSSLIDNYYFYINDPTTAGIITLSGGTLPTSATVDVKLIQLDPNMISAD